LVQRGGENKQAAEATDRSVGVLPARAPKPFTPNLLRPTPPPPCAPSGWAARRRPTEIVESILEDTTNLTVVTGVTIWSTPAKTVAEIANMNPPIHDDCVAPDPAA